MYPLKEEEPSEFNIDAIISMMYVREKTGMGHGQLWRDNLFENLMTTFSTDTQKAPFMLAYAQSRTVYTPVIVRNKSDQAAFNVQLMVDQARYPGLRICDRFGNNNDGHIPVILPRGQKLFFIQSTSRSVYEEHIRVIEDQKVEFDRAKIRKAMELALYITSLIILLRWGAFYFIRVGV